MRIAAFDQPQHRLHASLRGVARRKLMLDLADELIQIEAQLALQESPAHPHRSRTSVAEVDPIGTEWRSRHVVSFAKSEATYRHMRNRRSFRAHRPFWQTTPPCRPARNRLQPRRAASRGTLKCPTAGGDHLVMSSIDSTRAPVEIGGRGGPEPTRFGDWEKNGRCIDF